MSRPPEKLWCTGIGERRASGRELLEEVVEGVRQARPIARDSAAGHQDDLGLGSGGLLKQAGQDARAQVVGGIDDEHPLLTAARVLVAGGVTTRRRRAKRCEGTPPPGRQFRGAGHCHRYARGLPRRPGGVDTGGLRQPWGPGKKVDACARTGQANCDLGHPRCRPEVGDLTLCDHRAHLGKVREPGFCSQVDDPPVQLTGERGGPALRPRSRPGPGLDPGAEGWARTAPLLHPAGRLAKVEP